MVETISRKKTEVGELKRPPHSFEAEQAIIGGVMLDNQVFDKIESVLCETDFYRIEHRILYHAILQLARKSHPFDVVTLLDTLKSTNQLDDAGGEAYLFELANNTPSVANVSAYAEIVREKSVQRQLISIAGEIADSAYNPGTREVDDLLDFAESKVFAIAEQTGVDSGPEDIKTILVKAVDRIDALHKNGNAVTGLATGLTDLDELTLGLQPSDLVIVAGRPSMGKTTLVMNMAEHAAIQSKKPVLVFSMEMPADSLAMRMISSIGRIEQHNIRTGKLGDDDWPRLTSAVNMLSESLLFVDDSPALSPSELRARARRLAKEHGQLGLVVVDYLQLMKVPGFKADNRTAEISEISRSLKSLAKELNVPLVALSQLNRSLEQRQDKRPVMSDLRECVTGETLVNLADGRRVPIAQLVGQEVEVIAVDKHKKLVNARCEKIWSVGKKPVYKISFASGKTIRATAEHRIMTFKGWMTINNLKINDRVATARILREPVIKNTCVDALPIEVFEEVKIAMHACGITQPQMANLRGASYGGTSHFKSAPSRAVLSSYADLRDDENLKHHATNDIFWDRIVSIEADGEEEVYDLTVPEYASWLADGIVSHNSGAIEQDADVICFIYRDEVYNNESPDKGVAEIIVSKQRNGPIGKIRVAFLGKYTRFEDLAYSGYQGGVNQSLVDKP